MGRPLQDFEGFLGQRRVIKSVKSLVHGASALDRPLPHLLFTGPSGHGKSEIARAVAKAYGSTLHDLPATVATVAMVANLLGTQVAQKDIVFIDEIHALPIAVVVMLHTAMDRQTIPAPGGTGMIEVPQFTLVGATNRPGVLSDAFRQRFTCFSLDDYGDRELAAIARRVADHEAVSMTSQAAGSLARAFRSPREVEKRIRELVLHFPGTAEITQPIVDNYLATHAGVDADMLSPDARRYLRALGRANGRPLPQRVARSIVGCDLATIIDEVEPDLLRRGLIEASGKGRRLTKRGQALLERVPPESTECP